MLSHNVRQHLCRPAPSHWWNPYTPRLCCRTAGRKKLCAAGRKEEWTIWWWWLHTLQTSHLIKLNALLQELNGHVVFARLDVNVSQEKPTLFHFICILNKQFNNTSRCCISLHTAFLQQTAGEVYKQFELSTCGFHCILAILFRWFLALGVWRKIMWAVAMPSNTGTLSRCVRK